MTDTLRMRQIESIEVDDETQPIRLHGDPRPKPQRKKIRAFAPRAVPSGALLMQIFGALAALSGVYVLWGIAVTLIIGGVACLALGTLREAGKL